MDEDIGIDNGLMLQMREDDVVRLTRAAARLANGLTDINNVCGGLPEISSVITNLNNEISEFKGLESYGD